ncbi:MAG: phosphate acetyltransferase [Bacteroidota bacterium]
MLHSLYITTSEAHCGKSLVTLGVMETILRKTQKVAIFRPIIAKRESGKQDKDLNLILTHFQLSQSYEESYVFNEEEASELESRGKHDEIIDAIIEKYKALESKYDFVLIEGTDYETHSAAFEFNINIEIARNLGSPVIVVGRADHKVDLEVLDNPIQILVDSLKERGCQVIKVIVNRTRKSILKDFKKLLNDKLSSSVGSIDLIPENEILKSPTLREIAEELNAKVIYGHTQLNRLAYDYSIAAMQPQHYLERVRENCLVITPGDRGDIIMTALQAHQSQNYPSLAGILLSTGLKPAKSIRKLLDGLSDPLPMLSVETNTFETASALGKMNSYVKPENIDKINLSLDLFEKYVDIPHLEEQLRVVESKGITPKMFEYNLVQKAKSDKKKIVLPEGEDERILKAAEIIAARGLVDLVILGDETQIRNDISKLGLRLDPEQVEIIEPAKSSKYSDYVLELFERRKHKGVNTDMAKDLMNDVSYFGTMMVLMGDADGMVSGAAHTTQHTIRPALQLIKTKPGLSVVSSVFFMALEDRVLVYGDCAVNPNPNAEQLSEIASASAETSLAFNIEPKVAMLSYSSGASGKGEEVEKVRTATQIAKEKRPDLKIEGPIQYDAAVDMSVGQKKMPGSEVAGQASVLIFPDLNTGNNTYKAVQRETGAIAIGPVLQGLNKPVNDLSRGCTIVDIVNTVVITAIQAQNESK